MFKHKSFELVVVVTIVLFGAKSCARVFDSDVVSYKGYQVYEITAKTESDIIVLGAIENTVDFWKLNRQSGTNSTACVHPNKIAQFKQFLDNNNVTYTTIIKDLDQVIKNEEREQRIRSRLLLPVRTISFDAYARYDQINLYLEQLAARYPNLVNIVTGAVTPEFRPIKYLKISNNSIAKNRTIFIDAGIHAREWIAPSTALYVIQQLVENTFQNKDLLEKFDWVILPLANPDGYEYSHTKDRLWRKTRSSNKLCKGADANRNFDFKWGFVGASTFPCSDVFQGDSAFSEIEARNIRDIMESVKSNCKFYLTLHSYGNYLLYPWGYTEELPETWQDLDEVARAGANAIRSATGTKYSVGSSTNVLYAASGASDDYAFAAKAIPISITMELPGGGIFGFDLPPSRIRAVVEESWTGIRAMVRKVAQMY